MNRPLYLRLIEARATEARLIALDRQHPRRTRTAIRHDPDGPTPAEAGRCAAERWATARLFGGLASLLAVGLLLATCAEQLP